MNTDNVSILQADQEVMLGNLAEHERLWQTTNNPIHVWRALNEWFNIDRRNARASRERLAVPQWLFDPLFIWARRLCDLADGKDYNAAPEPFGKLPLSRASIDEADRRRSTLNTQQATKQVLVALGLVRPGWNALLAAKRQDNNDVIALVQEVYKHVGEMGHDAAVKTILEDEEVKVAKGRNAPTLTDPRSVAKRVQKSRRAREPKPP